MGYVRYPIESNPATILQNAYDYIKSRAPAWHEHDANLDTWILQTTATQASDLRILATDVPDTIFRYFGDTILGIPPNPAIRAIVTSTWTVIDQLGHLIPAGTLVGIRDTSGTLRGFETEVDISIIPGLTSTGVGEVVLKATEAGAASSNIGGNDVAAELIDPLDFVQAVTLTDVSAGGVDAEGIDDYTSRLAEFMRLLSTRPILAEDYALSARSFPGVYRAVAIDGYDPTNDSYFNTRTITVVGVDQFGLDLPDEVRQDLDDQLQAQREVNFVIWVIDPARTTINVDFKVGVLPNYSTTLVVSQAEAAVTTYLSPQNWGLDPTITGSDVNKTWVETLWLRYNKIVQVLENIPGVEFVQFLTINRAEDAPAMVDIPLDQPAALTQPGTITGAVYVP